MARSGRRSSTGRRPTALGAKSSRSSGSSPRVAGARRTRHVVCVSNEGYDASLERRKIYIAFVDREADKLGMMRVVDESGEDYLYPKDYFAEIKIAPHLAKALARSNR